jgi:hypothetical protein
MEGAILKMLKGMFSATFGDGRAKGPGNLGGCARHLVETDASLSPELRQRGGYLETSGR